MEKTETDLHHALEDIKDDVDDKYHFRKIDFEIVEKLPFDIRESMKCGVQETIDNQLEFLKDLLRVEIEG